MIKLTNEEKNQTNKSSFGRKVITNKSRINN